MGILSVFLCAFFLISASLPRVICTLRSPNIAIIGGGIGGTSCAYFLKELFGEKISLTLFEKDAVGGRLKVLDINGQDYEAGGAVIHPSNQHMMEFSKILGLAVRKPQISEKLGFYDGQKFFFEESDWYFMTVAKMIWRYGFSLFYLLNDVKSMLKDFSRIYSVQQKGYAYTSVNGLLDAMNPSFKNMSQVSIYDLLLKKGYPEIILNELVQATMMVNYGQTNNISGFAGFVSLAGADTNLWSVEGGNYLVPEGLLELSKAEHLKASVLEVASLPNETFSVKYSSNNQIQSKSFDIVVLSAPLIKSKNNIKFVNFKQNFEQFERPYHQTVTTFVKGTLNPLAFHRNSVPDEILTNNDHLLFNSISVVSPVNSLKKDNGKGVYKVFSQYPLTKADIEHFFQDVDVVTEKVWLAYPHYEPPEKPVPVILYPGLYYTNSIELAASAMEMSTVSSKNIALLIYNFWKKEENKINARKFEKDEL